MTISALDLVDMGDLDEYPIGAEDRLESHHWIAWEHRRWLNSSMRLKALPECRAIYFDLICVAQDQTPLGTLPTDTEELAKLVMVPLEQFQRLCAMEFGPLHNWAKTRCGDEIRLYHPTVLKIALDALSRKADNRARNEAANRQKRLSRLRSHVMGYHKDLAENDAAIVWIDDWLMERCSGYRTSQWIERAIQAWADRTLAARFDRKRPPD